jgi:voltage-gated potassium channel
MPGTLWVMSPPLEHLVESRDSRRVRWEQAADWPLSAAAALFLAAYAWPILDPALTGLWRSACLWVTWTTWAIFALDYVVRLTLSRGRARFVVRHVVDLAVVVLPLLRPLRLLRLVTVLSLMNRHAAGSLRGRVAIYVTGSTTLVLFCASLAVLDAERANPEANIRTFADAGWWATTTVTTVGYGDRYPTTGTGRLVAVGLMVAGIALIGVVTASFASWLLDKVREVEAESQSATRRDVEALASQVEALRNGLIQQFAAPLSAEQEATADSGPRPQRSPGAP